MRGEGIMVTTVACVFSLHFNILFKVCGVLLSLHPEVNPATVELLRPSVWYWKAKPLAWRVERSPKELLKTHPEKKQIPDVQMSQVR